MIVPSWCAHGIFNVSCLTCCIAQTQPFFTFVGQGLERKFLSGKIDILFANPESLLGDWRTELQHLNVTVIVIDELHLILTW